MDLFKGLGKIDWIKGEIHTKLFNKDTSLDIVRKAIKILTVILKSSMEGNVSYFVDVGLGSFLCYVEEKSTLFFIIFYSSRDIKITKA